MDNSWKFVFFNLYQVVILLLLKTQKHEKETKSTQARIGHHRAGDQ